VAFQNLTNKYSITNDNTGSKTEILYKTQKKKSIDIINPLLHFANDGNENGTRRLVIFAGPHKCASTTVESFFFNIFGEPQRKAHEAFSNWSMPMLEYDFPWQTHRPRNEKQYTYALREIGQNQELKKVILRLIERKYKSKPAKNVLLAAESFGKRDNVIGDLFIKEIASANHIEQVEIVLNYRSTRTDHLISNWKQDRDEKKAPDNFHEWLCTDEYTHNLNHRSMDIFGRAQKFLDEGWQVTLIDLGGVAKDDLDLSHSIACEVLKVPCTNGWINGWSHDQRKKTIRHRKDGNSELSEQEYNGMEMVFAQRDCLYANAFEQAEHAGRMKFLHRDSVLTNCLQGNKYEKAALATQTSLSSDEELITLLRDQVGGCQ